MDSLSVLNREENVYELLLLKQLALYLAEYLAAIKGTSWRMALNYITWLIQAVQIWHHKLRSSLSLC